ncbi:HesB/YadR/YfhF family protein [Alkalibacillus aidingensis]|uniref:HesB/YadR/YfhF family protein n=1 Tax=Alkalibacillus aidingensis TaxID=2747607 RepID=UPI00166172E6|nr:hypothetical protein [Alkalibacillus aidingensis]
MNIHVTEEAANWFKEEMDLKSGDSVRFFPKYGGTCSFQDGFSIGVTIGKASDPGVKTDLNEISFEIDDKDVWFFKDKDLYIGVKNGEVEYSDRPVE